MATYDGVVTFADDDIPVIVELDEKRIRLSASGTEIGDWSAAECAISHVTETTYSITAENETLHFVPNQPGLFAAAVNGGATAAVPVPPKEPGQRLLAADGVTQAPPPKPMTMALFYALCVSTAALAIWSLISMIVG